MNTIWKFPLDVTIETEESLAVRMPEGAEILTIQSQGHALSIWAKVNPNAPMTTRFFLAIKTNRPCPDSTKYIGTIQILGGAPVWHIFEKL